MGGGIYEIDCRDEMRVFYINRDVDVRRRERIELALSEIGLSAERVSGIEGYELPDKLRDYYDFSMPPGETGCSASHLTAASKILDQNLPWAVVLEDDARPTMAFQETVNEAVSSAPLDWDIIRLVRASKWATHTVARMTKGKRLVRYSKIPPGAAGLIVSAAGARKLLKPRTVRLPIDVEIKWPWDLKLNVFGVVPPVVHIDASLTSTISKRSRPRSYNRRARHLFNIQQMGLVRYLLCAVQSIVGLT